MTQGYFITGTDTGVGKTRLACALLHSLRQRGHSAVGMKPVAAGCIETAAGERNEDVIDLFAASSVNAGERLVNPYLLRQPIAPHIAAAAEGVTIDLDHIQDCLKQLGELAKIVVVEGVGGFKVPLGDDIDTSDLAQRLALPVILVVGMRLGCLNHALLTQDAIHAMDLPFAGWVANRMDPVMPCAEENIAALRSRLKAPLLGIIPHLDAPSPMQLANYLHFPDSHITTR